MLSGDRNKYSLKKSVGLISQKKKKKKERKRNHFVRAAHFLCTFLCPLFTFFFTDVHFHLGGR